MAEWFSVYSIFHSAPRRVQEDILRAQVPRASVRLSFEIGSASHSAATRARLAEKQRTCCTLLVKLTEQFGDW